MCYVHMEIRGEAHNIPFVANHINAETVLTALDDQGDLALYGTGDDTFRLRTLLHGLHVNLLSCRLGVLRKVKLFAVILGAKRCLCRSLS
jgi:hypothetical protein